MERSRFDYVSYDPVSMANQKVIKAQCQMLESCVDQVITHSRWKSLFMTHLEIAYMAVGKAIRDEQIKRDDKTKLEEGRGELCTKKEASREG